MAEPEFDFEEVEEFDFREVPSKPTSKSLGTSLKGAGVVDETEGGFLDSAGTFAKSAADSLTFGNLDYISGKIGGLLGLDEDRVRKEVGEELVAEGKRNPLSSLAGDAVGMGAGMLLPGAVGAKAFRGLSGAAKAGLGAGEGGLIGGLSDLEAIEEGDTGKIVENAFQGALLGGAAGGVSAAIGKKAARASAEGNELLRKGVMRRLAQSGDTTEQIRKRLEKEGLEQAKEGVNLLKRNGILSSLGELDAPRFRHSLGKAGERIEGVLKSADDAVSVNPEIRVTSKNIYDKLFARATEFKTAESGSDIANEFGSKKIARRVGNKLLSLAEEFAETDKDFSFSQLQKMKQAAGKRVKAFESAAKVKNPTSADLAKKQEWLAIRNLITENLEAIDPSLGSKYNKANRDYELLSGFKKSIGKKEVLDATPKKDSIVGYKNIPLFGRAAESAKDKASGVATGFTEFMSNRKLSPKYKKSLERAKNMSQAAYNAQRFLLWQSDPEFRQQAKKDKK